MPNPKYVKGANFERAVVKHLRDLDLIAYRSAGSHGPADVIAIYCGNVWLIQCKTNGKISTKERDKLCAEARQAGCPPILAWKPKPGVIQFDRLWRDGINEEYVLKEGWVK